MLALFLMNMLGLYGVFLGVQFNYSREVAQNLDDNRYAGADEMTFRVPLTLPYYTDSREYERVRGEFEVEGEVYQLVKQKLLRDTLYIVCVKDHDSKKIKQALADYVKTFTDKPENSKSGAKLVPQLSKDFLAYRITVVQGSTGWARELTFLNPVPNFLESDSPIFSPPPQFS
jgi:hypothetical protein